MSRRLRAAATVLAVAVCACGLPDRKLPPLSRSVRTVPRSFSEDAIARRRVSGVTMKIYNTGTVRTRGGAVSSLKSWSSRVKLDVPVFAIRHPEQGVILFDAGLTSATARAMGGFPTSLVALFESASGQDAASQLRADGTQPEDVRWIALSHLHRDHLGALESFPRATVVVSRREWEEQKRRVASRGAAREFDPSAWEARLRLRLVDLEGEPPYGAFDHGHDLFADGTVVLVALSGHTPGSMGAWANLDGGPVLLAGDAAWVIDNYLDLALPHKHGMRDPSDYRRSLEMLRAMQEAAPRLVIFPGHDLAPRRLSPRGDLPLAPFPRG